MLPKPVEPSAAIDQAVVDYGKMMRDLVPILDTHHESLKNMLIGFEHMVQYMGNKAYTSIVQSIEYKNIDSVRTLFQQVAPYLKPQDCSLLNTLVEVADCQEAKQRLTEYLNTTRNTPLHKKSTEPPERVVTIAESRVVTPVVSAKPSADPNTAVTATVRVNEINWGMLRGIQSLICRIFRIRPFALQYDRVEPGSDSLIIKWVTSTNMVSQMQSVVLDDGDRKLLKQKYVFSIRIGTEHTAILVDKLVSCYTVYMATVARY